MNFCSEWASRTRLLTCPHFSLGVFIDSTLQGARFRSVFYSCWTFSHRLLLFIWFCEVPVWSRSVPPEPWRHCRYSLWRFWRSFLFCQYCARELAPGKHSKPARSLPSFAPSLEVASLFLSCFSHRNYSQLVSHLPFMSYLTIKHLEHPVQETLDTSMLSGFSADSTVAFAQVDVCKSWSA